MRFGPAPLCDPGRKAGLVVPRFPINGASPSTPQNGFRMYLRMMPPARGRSTCSMSADGALYRSAVPNSARPNDLVGQDAERAQRRRSRRRRRGAPPAERALRQARASAAIAGDARRLAPCATGLTARTDHPGLDQALVLVREADKSAGKLRARPPCVEISGRHKNSPQCVGATRVRWRGSWAVGLELRNS